MLEAHERERAAKLELLRQEIQKGIDRGPAQSLTDELWQDLRDQLRKQDQAEPQQG